MAASHPPSVHDPKRGALLAAGFSWVDSVGVWLHTDRRKLISGRAVHDCSLIELLAFIRKSHTVAGWLTVFSSDPEPGVREALVPSGDGSSHRVH